MLFVGVQSNADKGFAPLYTGHESIRSVSSYLTLGRRVDLRWISWEMAQTRTSRPIASSWSQQYVYAGSGDDIPQ